MNLSIGTIMYGYLETLSRTTYSQWWGITKLFASIIISNSNVLKYRQIYIKSNKTIVTAAFNVGSYLMKIFGFQAWDNNAQYCNEWREGKYNSFVSIDYDERGPGSHSCVYDLKIFKVVFGIYSEFNSNYFISINF